MNTALTQQRIRIRFGKQGMLRFIGHLDFAQSWERLLRRARFPVEYTQGFNPRPRMQFAAALPVGVTSESEYVDIWLLAPLAAPLPGQWPEQLNAAGPAGLKFYDLYEVPIKQAALPTLVTHAEYVISLLDEGITPEELQARAKTLLQTPTVERTYRNKSYDLRPLILDLTVAADTRQVIARLVTGEQGNGRPDELLAALGLDAVAARIHRRQLFLAT